ncbi:MAG: type II toxin-antitoxin system ParD family antitoxin [Acetobacteraceae bacterium]
MPYSVRYSPGGGSRTTAVEKRTVSLPAAQASYIDGLVAMGAYASASEVVRAGLRASQERDAAVERWLRETVAPAHDAMAADSSRAIAADDVPQTLRARHVGRLKAGRGA